MVVGVQSVQLIDPPAATGAWLQGCRFADGWISPGRVCH
jgi:hypothetical protein